MAQLIDIRKVAIGPRFLTARIRVDDNAPLTTDEDPEGTARVLDLLPEIADHACLGDAGPLFGDAVDATELAHLFEHVTIELMARTGLAGDITSGKTKACVDEERSFEVRILCPDDVLAAGALSSAAFILDWAYTGGSDPKPAVDSIVEGLVSIVSSLDVQAEPEPSAAEAEQPVEAEPLPEDDFGGETIMMAALPVDDDEVMRAPAVKPEPSPEPEPEVTAEAEAVPRRSTILMVAGPGVAAWVAQPDPAEEAPAAREAVEVQEIPEPIMVAGPKVNV